MSLRVRTVESFSLYSLFELYFFQCSSKKFGDFRRYKKSIRLRMLFLWARRIRGFHLFLSILLLGYSHLSCIKNKQAQQEHTNQREQSHYDYKKATLSNS